MSLVSINFILFLIVLAFIYYLLPAKWQWVILLCGSLCFYALCGTVYTLGYVLLTTISVYITTYLIDKAPKYKKVSLIIGIVINIGLLAILKYIPSIKLIAALGISFYTLQMVGYLSDVYWGMTNRETNIFKVMLFNIYFPQMISGPISRHSEVKDEIFGLHKYESKNISYGFIRILFGFFKKLMVAEHLSALTDYLFTHYSEYPGIYVWIGTILYVLQLYADFSGCMDIVLGASKVLGITLPENFNVPFSALTIQEIWQRWHITLGTWLKNYIMFPLLRSNMFNKLTSKLKARFGKKAAKQIPTFIAMFVLWVCMGVWHGCGFNYIAEGLWFYIIIVLGQIFDKQLKKIGECLHIVAKSSIHTLLCKLRTMFLFAIGMLFFKSTTLTDAFKMLINGFNVPKFINSVKTIPNTLILLESNIGANGIIWPAVAIGIGFTFICYSSKKQLLNENLIDNLLTLTFIRRILVIWVMIMLIIILGAYGPGYSASEFIYGGF